jgi:hypothetical protein
MSFWKGFEAGRQRGVIGGTSAVLAERGAKKDAEKEKIKKVKEEPTPTTTAKFSPTKTLQESGYKRAGYVSSKSQLQTMGFKKNRRLSSR